MIEGRHEKKRSNSHTEFDFSLFSLLDSGDHPVNNHIGKLLHQNSNDDLNDMIGNDPLEMVPLDKSYSVPTPYASALSATGVQ